MVDRTKQLALHTEVKQLEKDWVLKGRQTVKLQSEIAKLKVQLKESKAEQDKSFSKYQKVGKVYQLEKQKNDKQNLVDKARQRRKAKKVKK